MADAFMRAGTEVATLIPEIWAPGIYPYLKENEPFIANVRKDYEGVISALGDTVNIQSLPQFDIAEDINEDQKVDAQALTSTQTQLVISKQSAKDYIMTGKAMAQSIDAQAELRDRLMHSIARRMHANIVAAISPSSAAPDHVISLDSAGTLALADLLEAKTLLDNQNVEIAGRKATMDVDSYNDLFNITNFISRDFIPAGSPITAGAIATPVVGFEVDYTSELSANTVYLYHPLFFQMAVQESPNVQVYDMGQQGYRSQRVNMTALYGVKQIDNLRVVKLS